jgi:hypothetical protein
LCYTCIMRNALILTCLALTACATPEIERTATFNQAQYEADLSECQGGNALTSAAKGLGGMVVGSFKGLFYGAYAGAISGNTPKGAAVGTVTGAVIGFVGGLYKPVTEHGESVAQCLQRKGYSVRDSL